MGIAIIAAKRVQIERNTFDRMSLDILDIEPDWANQGARDILFKDNTVGHLRALGPVPQPHAVDLRARLRAGHQRDRRQQRGHGRAPGQLA